MIGPRLTQGCVRRGDEGTGEEETWGNKNQNEQDTGRLQKQTTIYQKPITTGLSPSSGGTSMTATVALGWSDKKTLTLALSLHKKETC